MAKPSILHAASIAAATMLAGALLMVQSPRAVAADLQLAQAAPPTSTPAPKAKPARRAAADFIEARIKSLHDQLKITAAEEPKWSAVADAMRDNEKAVAALVAERAKKSKTMTAIDNLRSYQAIAKAHLNGIEKLLPAFEALYAEMPDTQKKLADEVFDRRPTRPRAKKAG